MSAVPQVTPANILVVDDQPVNAKLLERILCDEGWKVTTATSGFECLQHIQQYTPDIILLDIMMPLMDGITTCQKIRENPKFQAIPIIFITAKATKTDKLEGLQAGAVDYITKPIDADELVARVRTQLAFQCVHRQNMLLQQQLQEAKKAASIGAITEGIAHNLNNMLAGTLSRIDLLSEHPAIPTQVQQNTQAIQCSMQRMLETVHQLTLLTQHTPIALQAMPLQSLLEEALNHFYTLHNITHAFNVQYHGNEDLLIQTHPELFEDTLHRLLINAWEAYPSTHTSSERTIQISTLATHHQGTPAICIQISDTGIGLLPHIEHTLFEPFVSSHASVGRGLGLTIALQNVQNLRGTLTIRNRTPEPGAIAEWIHPVA